MSGSNEVVERKYLALRVDLRDALAHRFHLGLPDGRLERVDLPIDVGLGDVVEVDQREAPDAAARQRLDRPGTDPADAGHDDVRRANRRGARHAVEAFKPSEAALRIDVEHVDGGGRGR